ncbi:MAG: cardiolipin synthase [Prevotella sp.]|nr:cardiolipin synthase [Prevotella sp.]
MSIRGIIFLLYQVVVIATIIHVLMDNRQQAKTVAWALVIYFVPVVGILGYIFFGVNTRRERMVSRRSMDQLTKRSMLQFVEQRDLQLPEEHKPVIDLFVNENFSLPFGGNKVDILTSGYEFFPSLLRDISQAKSHIHIDVYIFEDDALGRLIADALMAKARQGVEVRVVYDDVGCWRVSNSFFEKMRREGIEVEPFMPVRFPSFARRANYRNHRKVFVIDGRVGYIGGMNIAVRYVKGGKGVEELSSWRDTMLRVEGRGVYSLQRTFLIDWYFVDRTLLSDRKFYPITNNQYPITNNQYPTNEGAQPTVIGYCSTVIVQTVTSGPTSPYPEIMQGFVRIIMAARRYVYLETPYFLPTSSVLYAMKSAAQSGVDVRLLVPARGDTRFIDWASRSYLREAVEAGVKVGLYNAGFLHSKLMVCDDTIATCGSTNIDFRSFENNFESNMFIYDDEFAVRMKDVFLTDEAHSQPLDGMEHRMNPRFMARLCESVARLFSPLL